MWSRTRRYGSCPGDVGILDKNTRAVTSCGRKKLVASVNIVAVMLL